MKKRAVDSCLPDYDSRRLVVLTGARQTGKTTLIKSRYPNLRYLNLDAMEYRDQLKAVSSFEWGRSVGDAFIDEAQKLPQVFDKVKFAFDDSQIRFTVLSGSAQILLLRQIRESLSGRAFIFELFPLMLSELLTGQKMDVPFQRPVLSDILAASAMDPVCEALPMRLDAAREDRLRQAEDHLLRWGGMPALLPLDDKDRTQWLRSYEFTYLERDVADLARLADLDPFKKMQRVAALRSAQLLSFSEIARDVGISADTVRRYVEYLRLSYQMLLLPPYGRNLTSQVIKTPKLFWMDLGLWRNLTGCDGLLSGQVFETFVVSELWKWIQSDHAAARLFFYRTRSGCEVDVLIETPKGIIGLEVKARETVDGTDVRALRDVASALGPAWIGGLCVYRGREVRRLGDPALWAIPATRMLSSGLRIEPGKSS